MTNYNKVANPARRLDYQSVIGSGSFGVVYKVLDKSTNELYAVKCSAKVGIQVSREYEILRNTSGCHHCVKFIEIFFTMNEKEEITQHLMFELMPDSLSGYIKKLKQKGEELTTDQKIKIMYQLLQGINELHLRKIMHRDIKPENILIDPVTMDIKICDFGSAKFIGEETNIPYIVSRPYRAPELILQCMEYGGEIDVWSAACIFIELFTDRYAFLGKNDGEQIYEQVRVLGPIPESSSIFKRSLLKSSILPRINKFGEIKDIKSYFFNSCPFGDSLADLIKKMLKYDQEERLTAGQCLAHELFSHFNL